MAIATATRSQHWYMLFGMVLKDDDWVGTNCRLQRHSGGGGTQQPTTDTNLIIIIIIIELTMIIFDYCFNFNLHVIKNVTAYLKLNYSIRTEIV
jgi:hypothetical protein